MNAWRKLSKEVLAGAEPSLFCLGDPQGEWSLREAVASYLHHARGVSCGPDQIVVGAGNDYLLMLLSVLLGREQLIAMENPTYKSAYRCFRSLGHPVRAVPLDDAGMSPEKLEECGARIAYVMPSHQFPMGMVMPIRRRMQLLSWAADQDGRYLIEDDYDSEFRYKGKPVPALQGYDTHDRVIYLGTFFQIPGAVHTNQLHGSAEKADAFLSEDRPVLFSYRFQGGSENTGAVYEGKDILSDI